VAQNKLPIEKIKQLADDIRTIENFAENHNFDKELLDVKVSISGGSSKIFDLPLVCMVVSVCFVVAVIAVLIFMTSLTQTTHNFIFLIGILFIAVATMATHVKFKEKVITSIVAVALSVVLVIGAGIFTPKEAIEKIENLNK
jgi:hypothetical protein